MAGGQPQQPSPSPGQSPLDQPRDQSPGDREQTPEMPPQDEPGGEKPKPERPEEEGGKPDSPFDSDDPGRNNPATPPDVAQPGEESSPDGADRWGDLPPRAREVFRTRGGADMPSQYRDWIDAYYRRLNRTRDL